MFYLPTINDDNVTAAPGGAGGIMPSSFGQAVASEFGSSQVDRPDEVDAARGRIIDAANTLAAQYGATNLPTGHDLLYAQQQTQIPQGATQNLQIPEPGFPGQPPASQAPTNAAHAAGQSIVDSWTSQMAALAQQNPDAGFPTSMDDVNQRVADQAMAAKQATAQVESRTAHPIFAGLVGGGAGQLTDPLQLATLLLPMSIEEFGGSMALRMLKLAGTQAISQGAVAGLEDVNMRSYYARQGMSDADFSSKVWGDIGGAALGGTVFAPALELGRVGVGKLFDMLKTGTPAMKLDAIDKISESGVSFGAAADADLANTADAMSMEQKMPYAPTAENLRDFAGTIDAKSAAIEGGNPVIDPNFVPKPIEAAISSPPRDVHAVARELDPETFEGPQGYDAVSAQRDRFAGWLDDLGKSRDADLAANPPHAAAISDIDGRIAVITDKVSGVEDRLTKTQAAKVQDLRIQRASLTDDAAQIAKSDTPDMTRIRSELQKTDQRMRDLAPDVSDAYRQAGYQDWNEPEWNEPAAPPAADETAAPVKAEPAAPIAAEPVERRALGTVLPDAAEDTIREERPVVSKAELDATSDFHAQEKRPLTADQIAESEVKPGQPDPVVADAREVLQAAEAGGDETWKAEARSLTDEIDECDEIEQALKDFNACMMGAG